MFLGIFLSFKKIIVSGLMTAIYGSRGKSGRVDAIQEKLDRVLVMVEWNLIFPSANKLWCNYSGQLELEYGRYG